MTGRKTALQQMTTRKYFHPTAANPIGAVCSRIIVACKKCQCGIQLPGGCKKENEGFNIPANCPNNENPMPMERISVGKISEM